MHKLVKIFKFGLKFFDRKLSSKIPVQATSNFINLETKTVYGGDLPINPYNQSYGKLLFNRLVRIDRREDVFQINARKKQSITTKTFLEQSVGLAERLQELGIQKGDCIILVGRNSINFNISLIGIFFSGAVPLPLSYHIHLDEFKIIVESSKPKYFGCEKKYLYSFKRALEECNYDVSRIFLLNNRKHPDEKNVEGFYDFIKGRGKNFESFEPANTNDPKTEPVLFMKAMTDGRVGRVVAITHHNLNSLTARYEAKDDGVKWRQKVFLQALSAMWMSGMYGLLLSCFFGSKLVILEDFDEEMFFKVVNDYKVTTTFLYSSKCWQLYKYIPKGVYDLSSCNKLFVVDGSLPKVLMDGLKEKIGWPPIPSYGLTEFSGLVLEPLKNIKKEGSSGQLVPQIYGKVISDTTHKYAGPNEKGELCFKGPTLCKGYVNDEKSNKSFFNKEGYFLSGLYGYYDEDGDFFIIDNIAHQISYKGYKVSPKELEGIIRSLPYVKDVCVSGILHPTDGRYPIAFVSLMKDKKVTEKEIIDFANGKVQDYKKLRGGVIFVTKIPRFRENSSINRFFFKKVLSKYRIKVNDNFVEEMSTKIKSSSSK